MNKIECSFCHKVVEINEDKVKKSGKAKIVRCEHCTRSIVIQYGDEKYYKEEE